MVNNEGINVISKIAEAEQKNQILQDSILNKMPCFDKYRDINLLSASEVEYLEIFHNFTKKEKIKYMIENEIIVESLFNCIKTDFNIHVVQYVLTFFYEVIRSDVSLYDYILKILKDKNMFGELIKFCTHKDSYVADKSAFLLSGSFCYNYNNNVFTDDNINSFIMNMQFFTTTEEGKLDTYINILKIDNYRKDIYELEEFINLIKKNLYVSNVTANKQYKAMFCVWLLTFKNYFIKKMYKDEIVTLAINLFKKCRVEKIVRISLNIIKNILHIDECFEIIVDNNIMQILTVLEYDKWRDNDIYDLIMQLLHKLDQKIKNFSNFERYCNELSKGKLKWSVLHTEKFWLENVMQFEKDEFKAIQKLAEIIRNYAHSLLQIDEKNENKTIVKSNESKIQNHITNQNSVDNNDKDTIDKVTVAVACFDLGEFARLYPNGKKICQDFKVKESVMLLITTKDRDVAREALLCAQKIMLNNWQSISSSTSNTK